MRLLPDILPRHNFALIDHKKITFTPFVFVILALDLISREPENMTQNNLLEFTQHIPDLMRYSERLCGGSRDCAERLVMDTLDAADKKRWKKTANVPIDAWLSMMLLQQHMASQR
jgi:hypothetical protein